MLIDHRFQGVLFAQGGGVFGAQAVQPVLGLILFRAFALDLPTDILNAGGQRLRRLGNGFEFKGDLAAFSAKALNINLGGVDLPIQPLRLTVERRHVLLGLDDLVANLRGRGHHLQHRSTPGVLLALNVGQRSGCRMRFLLARLPFMLGGRNFRCCRFRKLPVGLQFVFQRKQLGLCAFQFHMGGGRACLQL